MTQPTRLTTSRDDPGFLSGKQQMDQAAVYRICGQLMVSDSAGRGRQPE